MYIYVLGTSVSRIFGLNKQPQELERVPVIHDWLLLLLLLLLLWLWLWVGGWVVLVLVVFFVSFAVLGFKDAFFFIHSGNDSEFNLPGTRPY